MAERVKHGDYKTPLYGSWKEIKYRCNTPTAKPFKDYGGRGIKVCERWNEYLNFKEDMGPTWAPGLTLERKDVNGNYEPDNCCWVTKRQQNRNKRNTTYIDTPVGKMSLPDATEKYGLSRATLRSRVLAGVTDPEQLCAPAKSRPVRKRGSLIVKSPWGIISLRKIAIITGICYSVLRNRFNKHGENMSFEPFNKGAASKRSLIHSV